MNEPTAFRAGDSASWAESLPDYPASAGWSLKYRLLWPAGSAVDIATAPAGDDFAVTLASSDTSTWAAGQATLVSWVEKGTDRVTLEQKAVTILPDLTVATSHDGRSANKKALDQAEAALAAYAAGGKACVAEYEVAGRHMKFRDTQQILDLINHYKRLVAKETAALALMQGGSMPGRVYYRG
ncbi:MAG: hypothetical protein A2Z99_05470 [Treponema sp. GWB1_62_6]|nr:MAG: hypothetical protein A2Z99_05470 [Treponema sp. GWB1_62_6]